MSDSNQTDSQHLSDALAKITSRILPGDPTNVRTHTVIEQDFDLGVPSEFHGAQLLDSIKARLTPAANSVLLSGPPGTGKTHQVWAMFRANRRRRCGSYLGFTESWLAHLAPLRSKWIDRCISPEFDQVRIISESGDILRHRFDHDWLEKQARFPWWLVVDDVGFSRKASDWAIEAVYVLANERRARGLPTLWTTNLQPDEIQDAYSPAIASRLLGGAVLTLDGDDRRLA